VKESKRSAQRAAGERSSKGKRSAQRKAKPRSEPQASEAQRVAAERSSERLDQRLVSDGLAETRSRAEALIRAGRVLVDDAPVEKPGARVAREARIRLRGGGSRYVSRGGEKLAGALADFGIDPGGWLCLDVGASSGGFSDCLLQARFRRASSS
jgi:23S rRNA (cytidine1920-2'-O)/16S rRNA (cytidine1409-2'-O)-methyltransferase